jgi:glutamine amidotransferase
LIREFFTHAVDNPHGWGFAELSGNQTELIKSPEQADHSALANELLAEPICTTTALVHIRYATVGDITLHNAHPFRGTDVSGRQWTLIHKGTIFDFDALDPYFHTQSGSTDSERVLLYLIDQVNAATVQKGSPLEPDERFALFDSIVQEISPNNCVNLLVFDSTLLYVHSNYQTGLNVNQTEKQKDADNSVIFCTSELESAANPTAWKPLGLCTAFAYKQGELIYTGTTHCHEYRDSTEDTKYLYQDFASL